MDLSYDSSKKNILELSGTIRDTAVDRVIGALQNEVQKMEDRLEMLEDLFFGFDGSWEKFDARSDTIFQLTHQGAIYHPIRLQIFTTRGFFVNLEFKTDDRPDELRKDGVVGSVAETGEGWRYGVGRWVSSPDKYVFRDPVPAHRYNASRMLAGSIGDPLAVTAAKKKGHTTWMIGKLTYPLYFHLQQPVAAYRPLYGAHGVYHGTLEAFMNINHFLESALKALASSRTLQNMTAVMVDIVDKAILGHYNTGTATSQLEGSVELGMHYKMKGLYTMHSHPSVNVTALARYLDTVDGWEDYVGEFDQKDHFSEQVHLTLAKITVSGGRVADTGIHNWDVEMRDGACGACVVFDTQLQKEVMVFDGATTLHIYRNMTRRTPIVAQSRVSGPGEPWRSSYEAFADTLTHSDGIECVANTWHATATESEKRCLLRPDLSAEASYTVSMRIRPDVAYTETTPHATTPRLFSDSLVGDANIRLFANGQLYLFVLRYGCRTKATSRS
eukprot:TRINITY_DN11732_c0_g1_i5.p1 TRINITY_DN11732_c0_g1~~TRINITY_DN11732_c0_g1_i5.p1  ORF type:complete len:560 (+),score=152.97 TRINITY_DN11732_c0_g1_i5:182-1681(+)